jgi:hypothetical protein
MFVGGWVVSGEYTQRRRDAEECGGGNCALAHSRCGCRNRFLNQESRKAGRMTSVIRCKHQGSTNYQPKIYIEAEIPASAFFDFLLS